jgi:hypothetical protein
VRGLKNEMKDFPSATETASPKGISAQVTTSWEEAKERLYNNEATRYHNMRSYGIVRAAVVPAAVVVCIMTMGLPASSRTLRPRPDQHSSTVSSSKSSESLGGSSQGQVSPTRPQDVAPPGREPTAEEHERILKDIHDLNVKTGEQYKK